ERKRQMQLPRDLQPWARLLELFPRDLAMALGSLIQRLAPSIMSLRPAPLTGRAEPEGYSGLDTRGNFELLTPGELLWAEELPEEFERRAVMGEQMFFKRQLIEPSAAATSVALFDSGPEQSGEPRVLQIALLILLAARAEAAGADF